MLSELDQVGIRFFNRLQSGANNLRTDMKLGLQPTLFRGEMIELWMLKILCGLLASGNAVDRTGSSISLALNSRWLKILFERVDMPIGWGLYMRGDLGYETDFLSGFNIIFVNAECTLNGFIVVVNGLSFVLAVNDPPADRKDTLLEPCTYRPGEIIINTDTQQDILRIFWARDGDARSVTIGKFAKSPDHAG